MKSKPPHPHRPPDGARTSQARQWLDRLREESFHVHSGMAFRTMPSCTCSILNISEQKCLSSPKRDIDVLTCEAKSSPLLRLLQTAAYREDRGRQQSNAVELGRRAA